MECKPWLGMWRRVCLEAFEKSTYQAWLATIAAEVFAKHDYALKESLA